MYSNLVKILSNYFGKLWNILSVFLLVPVYIHYLGLENYGIISLYAVVMGLISFADAGMSSAIIREFSLNGTNASKYHILRKIEVGYWSVIILLIVFISFLSSVIAREWIIVEHINFIDLRNYIILIGVGAGFQLVSSIYFGALFGLGNQVGANVYQIIWTTCKSFLVVALFELLDTKLYVFLIWQIVCNIFYIIILRWHTVKLLKIKGDNIATVPFRYPLPKRILAYIGGMSMVSIITAINLQADKLVISYFFSLKIFSLYTIASILSQIPVMISAPLASFVFPILSKFSHSFDEFKQVFEGFTTLIYLLIFSVSFIVFFYPLEIFSLWTRQPIDNIAGELDLVIKFLILGSILLAMQFPFYYTLLAYSKTKYTVFQGFLQIIIGIPLLVFFAKIYGIKYIGVPWFLINLLGFVYLMYICLRKYLYINIGNFVIKHVVFKAFIGFILAWLGHVVYRHYSASFVLIFFLTSFLSFFSMLIFDNIFEKRNFLSYKHLYNFPRV
jgi:O-antigen/teichoic acid export membrane protein